MTSRCWLHDFYRAYTDAALPPDLRVAHALTEAEVSATVQLGEQFPAKFGRTGFRRDGGHGKDRP
jgi:hypothetical protein